ncbi:MULTISPECIES: hypothetical protein [Flavobacterium]|uniref:hypothetical protein n=1 Tax=Flavobacterium TaxID=237 RepID=UPI0021146AB8|nr:MULTISPECIES: hypothetical protein [Flavobacterium]UUF16894.1 hypothetical protein NLJ00_12410 [Flavobacterium panici]
MTSTQIQSIGNFLAYYKTDLNYIKRFQYFKLNPNVASEYIKKDIGSFYSFLIEFRVVRNFKSGSVDKLLEETLVWINSKNSNDVDLFAERLAQSNLTRGKVTTSMASKILFLNNPWEIIPMDRLARKTLNQKENNYSIYNKNLIQFQEYNEHIFEKCLDHIRPLITLIHNDFSNLDKLDIICKNRITDKLLWTMGNNKIF